MQEMQRSIFFWPLRATHRPMKKERTIFTDAPLLNSNTPNPQLAHWVLPVRLLHFPNEVFHVGQILTNEGHAFSVRKLLPLRLELFIPPHLWRVDQWCGVLAQIASDFAKRSRL